MEKRIVDLCVMIGCQDRTIFLCHKSMNLACQEYSNNINIYLKMKERIEKLKDKNKFN